MISFEVVDAGQSETVHTWLLEIPVDRHPEPCWPGLWELEYPEGPGNPFHEYGVSNGDSEFFHLVRAMAWTTAGGLRLVSPGYYRDEAALNLGLAREATLMAAWEYEIDEGEPDFCVADHGYQPARACVPIRPKPDLWQMEHARLAGMFPITRFQQLTDTDVAVAADASSQITLYGLHGAHPAALAEALNSAAPPTMAEVLEVAETFVDLTQVRGLYSSGASRLVVRSRHDLTTRLSTLAERASLSWQHYQTQVGRLRSWPDFHTAMTELTAPVLALATE